MIDKFKIKGIFSRYSTYNLSLLKEIQTDKGKKSVYRIPNDRNNVCLYLTQMENSNLITINGNLRKWRYGKRNAFHDLSYRSYINCLKYLAEVLEVDLFELLQFKIRNIELGANIELNRKFDGIFASMVSYPKRQRLNYYDEAIMFEGRKYDIKIYDKLKESAKKNIKSKKLAEKLIEKKFSMRFELDIRAKSGLRIKNKLDSLQALKDNWNDVVDYILEIYSQIEIVDEYSELEVKKTNGLNLTETKELFIFKAIEEMGISKADKMIYDYAGRKKSEYKRKLRDIYWKYKKKDKSPLKRIVSESVRKRFEELRKVNFDINNI